MSLFVQAHLSVDSGVTVDRIVNTFMVDTQGVAPTTAKADGILAAIDHFYSSTPAGQAHSISYYLSSMVDSTAGLLLKGYNATGHLDGTPMGSPFRTRAGGLESPGSSNPMPHQLACVLTLEGQGWDTAAVELSGPPVTRPKSRRRGRLYLGPFNELVRATGTGDAAPSPTFRGVVFAAVTALKTELAAVDGTYKWSVWSRSLASNLPIVSVSMDDRFDVIQSRKVAPAARTRLTV